MARIEELESRYNHLKSQAARVQSLEGNIQQLLDNGLLRYDAEGNVHSVASYEEHQQLQQLKQ